MLVDADVLHRARKGQREAVIEVLSAQYPSTYRMAHGLSGREDAGDGIVTFVTKQSFRVMPKWADEEAPQRWFRHHTLLTVRRASRWKPDAENDTLLRDPADRAESQYVAFIRALRGLPQQQVEAFLLSYGEKLDLRSLAVAMDCSTTAASIHLKEAEDQLRQLAGEELPGLVVKMQRAYERLTPPRDLVLSRIGSALGRRFWPRFLGRLLRLVIFGAILGALAWVVWRFGAEMLDWARGVLSWLRLA